MDATATTAHDDPLRDPPVLHVLDAVGDVCAGGNCSPVPTHPTSTLREDDDR